MHHMVATLVIRPIDPYHPLRCCCNLWPGRNGTNGVKQYGGIYKTTLQSHVLHVSILFPISYGGVAWRDVYQTHKEAGSYGSMLAYVCLRVFTWATTFQSCL